MSVRVNLLPREAEEREARRRVVWAASGGALVFLGALTGLNYWQASQVEDARARLAEAEAARALVQAEVDELAAYDDLADRREAAAGVVTAAMGTEASLAGVLQDLAVVMPDEAALTGLNVTLHSEVQAPTDFDFGGPSYGKLTATGEARDGHAPGVERFLIEFDKIAAFFNVFVTSSTVDESGISTFNIETDLGPEVFTRRYLNGVPEELR